MRIVLDDKPIDRLTPKQEKIFFLAKKKGAVEGRVFTRAEATEAFVA